MLTETLYGKLVGDGELTAMLATYGGLPAVFTTDPAPGDAVLPYLVTAGEIVINPDDTKTDRGQEVLRDVRCYAAATGSAVLIEAIAARVRVILHRQPLSIPGMTWLLSETTGPVVADEPGGVSESVRAYGRVVTLRVRAREA